MGTIIPKVLNWAILTPFYTNVLGKEGYGSFTELYAYVVILNVIITFGMETGLFRFGHLSGKFKEVFTTSFLVVLVLSLLLVIGVNVFVEPLSQLIKYEDNQQYLVWFSLIIALDSVAAIPFAKLRHQQRPGKFARLKLANVGINISLVFVFLLIWPAIYAKNPDSVLCKFYNPDLGVGYAFLANLITSVIIFLLISGELKDLGRKLDKKIFIDLIRFSAPLVIVGIAGSINEVADKILLKFWSPEPGSSLEVVGIYGANYRVAVLMTLFVQMFRYAFEPFLFAQKSQEDAKVVYARIMEVFFGLGLLLFLGSLFYMDFVKFFIGKEFREGLGVVPIVLMANLFLGVFYNLSVWYKIKDLTRYGAILAVIGSVVTLSLNALLIPKMGYHGSAWATLACYTVMMVVSFLWGRRFYRVNYRIGKMLFHLVFALILFAISEWLRPDEMLWRIVFNTVLIIVFLGVLQASSKILSVLLGREKTE